jgi:hypothetical protein
VGIVPVVSVPTRIGFNLKRSVGAGAEARVAVRRCDHGVAESSGSSDTHSLQRLRGGAATPNPTGDSFLSTTGHAIHRGLKPEQPSRSVTALTATRSPLQWPVSPSLTGARKRAADRPACDAHPHTQHCRLHTAQFDHWGAAGKGVRLLAPVTRRPGGT